MKATAYRDCNWLSYELKGRNARAHMAANGKKHINAIVDFFFVKPKSNARSRDVDNAHTPPLAVRLQTFQTSSALSGNRCACLRGAVFPEQLSTDLKGDHAYVCTSFTRSHF